MSRRLPDTDARRAPENLGVLLREPLLEINQRIHRGLQERGFDDVRPAHGNVFQYLDDAGTRVGVLAERAHITKQSMGELVAHLEAGGYLERVPDPADGRARLVRATEKGRAINAVAREVIAETLAEWTDHLGPRRMQQLRALLVDLNAAL